jgi:thioredoxin 1
MEQLNDESFEEKSQEKEKSLILFSAEWCGPCKIIKPILEEIKSEMDEDFPFYVIDVNESVKTTEKYNVRNIPTGVILVDGEEKIRFTGAKNKEQIKNLINNFLN